MSADEAAELSPLDRLSPKRRAYVEEYLIDLNQTKAAIRAGYPPASARQTASAVLMTDPDIVCAIESELHKRRKRTGITADRVLRELAAIAFADIGDVMSINDGGLITVRPLEGIKPHARRAIESITQTSTERTEQGSRRGESTSIEKVKLTVKMHSKVAALKMLVDHLGMSAPLKLQFVEDEDGEEDLSKLPTAEIEARYAKLKSSGT